MAELPRLNVGISLDSATFVRETAKVTDAVRQVGQQVSQQSTAMQQSFGAVGGAVKAFATGLAGAVGTASFAGFVALTKHAINLGDELQEVAKRTGVTVEQLQGLQFAAEQTGGSSDSLRTALEQFNKRVGEAGETNNAFAKALKEQGIAIKDSEGNFRSTKDILVEYADAIAHSGSSQEKARLTQLAFGKSASELIGLFSEGAEGIRGYLAESERLGQITSEEAAASDRANDAMNRANKAFSNARDSILIAAAPAFEKFADVITKLIEGFKSLDPQTQAIVGGIAAFAGALVPLSAALAPLAIAIAALSSPILLVVGAIVGVGGLVAAIFAFRDEIQGAFSQSADAAHAKLVDLATSFTDTVKAFSDQAGLTAALSGIGQGVDDIVAQFTRLETEALAAVQALVDGIKALFGNLDIAGSVSGPVNDAIGSFTSLRDQSVGAVQGMVSGIQDAMSNKLQSAMGTAKEATDATVGWFKSMSDQLVGRSIVPDLISEIGHWMGLLDIAMVKPAAEAIDATNDKFAELTSSAFESFVTSAKAAYASLTGTAQATTKLTATQTTVAPALAKTTTALTRQAAAADDAAAAVQRLSQIKPEFKPVDQAQIDRLAKAGEFLRTTSAPEERFDFMRESFQKSQRAAKEETDKFAKQIEGVWEGVGQNIQGTFYDTYKQIFSSGIVNFTDLASAIKDIFINLAANIATIMTIQPVVQGFAGVGPLAGLAGGAAAAGGAAGFGQGFTTPGGTFVPAVFPQTSMFGTFGGAPGGFLGSPSGASLFGILGAGGLGALGGTLIGGQFGGRGNIGGGVLGGLGAAAGTAFLGPLGGLAGGLGGSLLGGFVGSLFGGKGQTNKVSIGGGLGAITGTGAAAQFVAQLDKQIAGLLDTTQKAAANRALELAQAVKVQYSKQPSANDLAALTAGRVGPVAGALGLNVGAIAVGTQEEQIANLTAALGVLKQIQSLNISPVAAEIDEVNKKFQDLADQAVKFGISTVGITEAWQKATQELVRQQQSRWVTVAGAVGTLDPFAQQFEELRIKMEGANATAQELGISTENLSRTWHQAYEALQRQQQAQIDQMALSITSPFQQLAAPLKAFGIELQTSLMNPLEQFNAAAQHFRDTASAAAAGSTEAIQELTTAGQAFIQTAAAVGASPAAVKATQEVQAVIAGIQDQLKAAQSEASRGLEGAIWGAAQRQVDSIYELIQVGRDTITEIKKLSRTLT